MNHFPITRVYADNAGESHFENVTVPMSAAGPVGWLSEEAVAKGVVFRVVEPTYDWDFHTAPQRQYIVLLDGEIELETSTGVKRRFGAGEVLLVEDTWGKGHRTKNLRPNARKSIFITLP